MRISGTLPDTVTSPEFEGTCMRQHGGTTWYMTKAPVKRGADFTLIFSIFDLTDALVDSYAFIDNFRWDCESLSAPTTNEENPAFMRQPASTAIQRPGERWTRSSRW